jgi:hypothetical protein
MPAWTQWVSRLDRLDPPIALRGFPVEVRLGKRRSKHKQIRTEEQDWKWPTGKKGGEHGSQESKPKLTVHTLSQDGTLEAM